MDFWVKAAQLLLSLSILVVLHELGHFIPARLFKTRVEKFYLFFNWKFSLYKKKIGETEWGIGWIPLGGYVKIAGMIDESMDKEQMAQPAQPWEFRAKPAWQRLIIMTGGVIVNLIVGFVIYMMVLFFWGQETIKTKDLAHGYQVSETVKELGFRNGDKLVRVDGKELTNVLDINRFLMLRSIKEIDVLHADGSKEKISVPANIGTQMWENDDLQPFLPRVFFKIGFLADESPAANAGLQIGDSILSVNDHSFTYYDEYHTFLADSCGEDVFLDVQRKGKILSLTMQKDSLGKIGVGPDYGPGSTYQKSTIEFSFGEAITGGFSFGYWTLHDYAAQFKYLFTKKGASSMGGFGAMGKMFPSTWDWRIFWLNTALISIILAFMNILPIPALDGGHVVFLLYEMITGKEAPQKVLEIAQYIGFFFILSLVLYANGNDLYQWLFGK